MYPFVTSEQFRIEKIELVRQYDIKQVRTIVHPELAEITGFLSSLLIKYWGIAIMSKISQISLL